MEFLKFLLQYIKDHPEDVKRILDFIGVLLNLLANNPRMQDAVVGMIEKQNKQA